MYVHNCLTRQIEAYEAIQNHIIMHEVKKISGPKMHTSKLCIAILNKNQLGQVITKLPETLQLKIHKSHAKWDPFFILMQH